MIAKLEKNMLVNNTLKNKILFIQKPIMLCSSILKI